MSFSPHHDSSDPQDQPVQPGRHRTKAASIKAGAVLGSVALGAATVVAALPSAGSVAQAATTPAAAPVALTALADQAVGSTVAPNGDKHPYAIAVVPPGYTGTPLAPGDVLVGDIANAVGVKGDGKSIVKFHLGTPSLFSTAVTGPVAQTFNADGSALWVAGYGTADNGSAGAISVLETKTGTMPAPTATPTATATATPTATATATPTATATATPTATATVAPPVATVAGDPYPGGSITDTHGPWGITDNASATAPVVFWANADGTIVRDSKLAQPFGTSSATVNVQDTLATLSHGASPSLAGGTVVAPQGMVYDAANDTLFVADSASDQIVALKGAVAATGAVTPTVLVKGGPLHTPQGLAMDPNTGNLYATDGAHDNRVVELTQGGAIVHTRDLGPKDAAGSITGIATTKDASGATVVYYVNDATDTLHMLSVGTAPVTIGGAAKLTAQFGTPVTITGRAPAGSTVEVYFHRAYVAGYVQRRTLQADRNGVYVTSFKPNDDYRYYVKVGTVASHSVLEQATPTILGSTKRIAKQGATIVIVGHGTPHSSVRLHFHKQGTSANDYSLLRSVHVDAHGVWTKTVNLKYDYRVFASRGSKHPYTVHYLLQGI